MNHLRIRILSMLAAASVCVVIGCEPLDSDMEGDAQQEPSREETAGAKKETPRQDTASADQPRDTRNQPVTERIDSLESAVSETRDQVAQIRQELDALQAGGTTGATRRQFDPPGAYKIALEQFFNHQYEESAAGFRKVLDDGQPAETQSNSQYWIGECEYGLHRFDAAIASFRKVFSFPSSTKYDDAQMMIAMSYLRLNNRGRARQELRTLIEQYPESEFVPRARRILATL